MESLIEGASRTFAAVGEERVEGSVRHEVDNHGQRLQAHSMQAQDVGMLQSAAIGWRIRVRSPLS